MPNFSLADFLLGKKSARRAVLAELFNHPGEELHLRELARRSGYSSPMVSKELDRLVPQGVVVETKRGQRRGFRANLESPLARDILRLVAKPEKRAAAKGPATDLARQARKRRPKSLHEAATWGQALGKRDAMLREFLDEFYSADNEARAGMLQEEPPLVGNDDRANAYYGAVAEHLSRQNRLPVPSWTDSPSRFLGRPFFPAGLESLKATLVAESPAAFRRRMIFVEREPLYRPRQGPRG